MQIFSTFTYSTYLELAITSLEQKGISPYQILAIPLEIQKENVSLFDSIHHSDGISLFDTGAALGTAFAVIGASVGFNLEWGPIYWGLIGATGGFTVGFLCNYIYYKFIKKVKKQEQGPEVILIIECLPHQVNDVKNILKEHFALATAVLP
ncbi:hypothetical protein [Metabacillus iocasae]|uniref:Uncharacterized protein n=1 Tax=Priestia iocasae TaxID=2291674 RepID=A0ABS2QW17_9BACI|nr:hypothetical protein [Metabacillus iocasae]MBM7703137.1 hypothetical protein [Metabacillus iocasae]